MSKWRSIETAPIQPLKHAEPMLLFCPGTRSWNRYSNASDIMVGAWDGRAWYSDIGDVDQGYESTGAYFEREALWPTHWMPLPKQPRECVPSGTSVPSTGNKEATDG